MCMLHHHEQNSQGDGHSSAVCKAWYRKPYMIAGLIVAILLGAYLWLYHAQHALAALPFVVFLACPLMHVFGHRHGQSPKVKHD